MAYVKYLRSLVLSFLVCWLIFLVAVGFQIGAPTETSSWTYRTFLIKSKLAQSVKSPKLMVLSGSNGLYGVSCEMMQKETKIPCVNAGVGVYLTVDYLMRAARDWAKPGDLVILPLEYEYYAYNGIPQAGFIDYVFSRDPNYLKVVDFLSQVRFFSSMDFDRLKQGIASKLKYGNLPEKVEASSEFNQYGDELKNREADLTKAELNNPDRFEASNLLSKGGAIEKTLGLETIRQFITWCKDNNIKVVATWPSTIWFDFYQGKRQQELFSSLEQFYRNMNVIVLGKPREFMYSMSMFSNSSYHLHDRAARQRTKQLLDLLQPHLKSFQKQA
jgi:hypothetical protein